MKDRLFCVHYKRFDPHTHLEESSAEQLGGTVMYCGGERGTSVLFIAHPRPSAVHARASCTAPRSSW